MRKGIFIVIVLAVLFAPKHLWAQITANPTNGCAPLSGVQFTGPSGASNITWDFGNGESFADNSASFSYTYDSVGFYAITLSYTDVCGNSQTDFEQFSIDNA